MVKSINQLDKELELLADAHGKINDYVFDDVAEAYTANRIKHTCLIAAIAQSTSYKDYDDFVLRLWVCDKVYDDRRNEKDVRSDTYGIIKNLVDVIASSPRWQSWTGFQGGATANYFREDGTDVVDGWV